MAWLDENVKKRYGMPVRDSLKEVIEAAKPLLIGIKSGILRAHGSFLTAGCTGWVFTR